ncbi:cytochrome bc1 complex Rieske iron-sulfur subunit [Salinactinospora qingdaonensis]|uniref:Cytochrome bc1 complex Rieske iron-sulfur subunit n=1 Tax=Salinactinospora qingdaonensis TaxID=702744 RepID=A0ABP7FCB6_9ACTN
MTDNTSNHDNTAGDGARERILGTPSGTEGALTEVGPGDHRGHSGPYPAAETHTHTEEEQRKGERVAALWFTLAFLAGIGFLVSYFLFPPGPDGEPAIAAPAIGKLSNLALGGTLAVALFAIGAGMTVWTRRVMPHYEVSSPYDEMPSPAAEKRSFSDFFMRGGEESGITKRPLMRRTLLLSMLPLGLAPILLLRDLGPLPRNELHKTPWQRGQRMVVEGSEREILASDLEEGGMITALPSVPEGEHLTLDEQAQSVILLIKMNESEFGERMTGERLNWTHDGIVAYSKICTHVGCPAALYEQTTHRILCPCHQSTFDATNAAEVVFGPANRPLPQLPLTVDGEGYLVADGEFSSAVGPTFWDAERDV